MKQVLAALLLLGAVPASATTVEVATGNNWNSIPLARERNVAIDMEAIGAIHEMVESGECVLPGQRKGKLDLTVPFLIHFAADGSVDRLVIQRMGCAKAEGVIAGALLKLLDARAYRPTGVNPNGWYRNEVSFSYL